ncbi:MAG: hypothetical protein FD129_3000 [bacterium]|nr:MAG: hypothetical protein FD129_3000 [bacterium]
MPRPRTPPEEGSTVVRATVLPEIVVRLPKLSRRSFTDAGEPEASATQTPLGLKVMARSEGLAEPKVADANSCRLAL